MSVLTKFIYRFSDILFTIFYQAFSRVVKYQYPLETNIGISKNTSLRIVLIRKSLMCFHMKSLKIGETRISYKAGGLKEATEEGH